MYRRYFIHFYFYLISLIIADGPHHYHPACGHKGFSHLSPVHVSRCKFSTLTTRQPMVEFYLLTFPRFPLRKKEHKSYISKNRTHDFRTSRCADYLLDHSGDEATTAVMKDSFRGPSRMKLPTYVSILCTASALLTPLARFCPSGVKLLSATTWGSFTFSYFCLPFFS